MFFGQEFSALVVDDEPDVLSITRLALRNVRVYGLPVRVTSAASKAEAIELLSTKLATQMPGISQVTVAFIDVVMETDHAGLELCQHIRETMGNKLTQIYVRTGQPGVAPERTVIDRYDISGYLSKIDATEDKLYTLMKTGSREATLLGTSLGLHGVMHALLVSPYSRRHLAETLNQTMQAFQYDPTGRKLQGVDIRACVIVDNEVIAGAWGAGPADAIKRRDALLKLSSVPLNATGDTLTIEGTESLLKIAATTSDAEVYYLTKATVPPPDFVISLTHGFFSSFSAIWKHAG